jgi:FkbM family methyltransferase
MPESWKFRPNTLDRLIFNGVVLLDEYRLPRSFSPDDIVVDIGAHIGSFAHAVIQRGCQRVFCVEPDLENLKLAEENLAPGIEKNQVQLIHAAVWRSDPNDDELRFDGYHPFPRSYGGMDGIINTGNGSVIWGQGEQVGKIAFDELVDRVTNKGEERIRLLKLDCEGSEWPILSTSKRLHLVEEICGEFHEIGGHFPDIGDDRGVASPVFKIDGLLRYSIDELISLLAAAGFATAYTRHERPSGESEGAGLFFADRRPI